MRESTGECEGECEGECTGECEGKCVEGLEVSEGKCEGVYR